MIHGLSLDSQSRCHHYSSPRDIVAIQFPCCQKFYACRECHDALEDHAAKVWGKEVIDDPIVYCGQCKKFLTAREYFTSKNSCPHCKAPFNPNCALHHTLYFSAELIQRGASPSQ